MQVVYWVGHIAQMEEERDHFEDIDIDGKMILKWSLNRIRWLGLDLSASE